nr:unnamed protein product [Digitaria exilis]
MATATEPEGAPPAGKGEPNNMKRSKEQGEWGGAASGGGQKRKKKEVFIYGNYRNYYGYRIDRNVGEDPRLEAFNKQWFENKDCLDIGCNQGLVTIGLAMKFKCQRILGIDIDSGLIETAKWNLRRVARQDKLATQNANAQESSNSPSQSSPGEAASELSNGKEHQDLLKIVSFQHENFVESLGGSSERYDTILCLSVTKWIHLNWGDDGLVTLFVKIWRLLRPVARENFNSICLYPENFREILLDKVGFRSVELIMDRLVGTVSGFDRPIEVYHK